MGKKKKMQTQWVRYLGQDFHKQDPSVSLQTNDLIFKSTKKAVSPTALKKHRPFEYQVI